MPPRARPPGHRLPRSGIPDGLGARLSRVPMAVHVLFDHHLLRGQRNEGPSAPRPDSGRRRDRAPGARPRRKDDPVPGRRLPGRGAGRPPLGADGRVELVQRGLHDEMRYKIACRSDELRPELLGPLVESGLCHVYLGVESGDEQSLLTLNKLLEAEAHVRAGRLLREFDLSFDFGYMLMEPWSTVRQCSRQQRVPARLHRGRLDGRRLLPNAALRRHPDGAAASRGGTAGRPQLEADYQFLDPRLDLLWDFSQVAFEGRNFGPSPPGTCCADCCSTRTSTCPGAPRPDTRTKPREPRPGVEHDHARRPGRCPRPDRGRRRHDAGATRTSWISPSGSGARTAHPPAARRVRPTHSDETYEALFR